MTRRADPRDLDAMATSLESLQKELHGDVSSADALTNALERERVESDWLDRRATRQRLAERVRQLREGVEFRRRTLARLRARMHQIRGGAKPH